MTKTPDPTSPLRPEAEAYAAGWQELAIQLYSERLLVSHVTAEDNLRKHLTELGFTELPPLYLPREN